MNKYYIGSIESLSGIGKYSRDFYNFVLKERGYEFISSSEPLISILSKVGSKDSVHIEIGIFQRSEVEILLTMLKANYRNVSITLHDAPLLKYPFLDIGSELGNKFSKLIDRYGTRLSSSSSIIRKLKAVYVLSEKGMEAVKTVYKASNVYFLPHIIDEKEIDFGKEINNNFIYFGFIGNNKGIEYALMLHNQLLSYYPEMQFYVVGKAIGKQTAFYEELKKKYTKNVHFLGYVPDRELGEVFSKATFAIQLFKDYRFFCPFSGSVLFSMVKGKVVLTSRTNAIPEVINDGENGFFLSNNLEKDMGLIRHLISNRYLLDKVKTEVKSYLIKKHSPVIVNEYYKG